MVTIAELLQELDQEATTTRLLIERVPDDQFDWKPHEKSMTLGQLAMHIAMLPGGIAEISTWSAFDIAVEHPRSSASSTAAVLDALNQSVARARTVLGGMEDGDLATPWRLVNGDQEILNHPARGALPVNHAEPLVSPPRPAHRVSAADRGAAPPDLRSQRG